MIERKIVTVCTILYYNNKNKNTIPQRIAIAAPTMTSRTKCTPAHTLDTEIITAMKRYAIPAHTLNRKIAIAMMNALAVWRLGILSGLLFFAKTGATPYRTYGRSSFMIIRRSVIPKNTPAGTVSDFKNKSFCHKNVYTSKIG